MTLIQCPLLPVLPQWHSKDPGHSEKKCRLQVTDKRAYTQPNEVGVVCAVQVLCGNALGKQHATRQKTLVPKSSQFAEPLWTDPGIMSGIGKREIIST